MTLAKRESMSNASPVLMMRALQYVDHFDINYDDRFDNKSAEIKGVSIPHKSGMLSVTPDSLSSMSYGSISLPRE